MGRVGPRVKAPHELTSREEEVLGLVRMGLTNEEIGERLGISANGVKYHVSEILSKLGVGSREEAAAWRPEERRAYRPGSGQAWWRVAWPLTVAKGAGIALAAAALVGLGVLGWSVIEGGGGSAVLDDDGAVCAGGSTERFVEAEEWAWFDVYCPSFLPEGYVLDVLKEADPGDDKVSAGETPNPNTGLLTAVFVDGSGSRIQFLEGNLGNDFFPVWREYPPSEPTEARYGGRSDALMYASYEAGEHGAQPAVVWAQDTGLAQYVILAEGVDEETLGAIADGMVWVNGPTVTPVTRTAFPSPILPTTPTPSLAATGAPSTQVAGGDPRVMAALQEAGFAEFAAAFDGGVEANSLEFFVQNARYTEVECGNPGGIGAAPRNCLGRPAETVVPVLSYGIWNSEGGYYSPEQFAEFIDSRIAGKNAPTAYVYALGHHIRAAGEAEGGIDLVVAGVGSPLEASQPLPGDAFVFRVAAVDGAWGIVGVKIGRIDQVDWFFDWWAAWGEEPGVKAADSLTPVAGICAGVPDGDVATIELASAVPSPRCQRVLDTQRVRFVNGMDETATFSLGRIGGDLKPGDSLTSDLSAGEFLAEGVHFITTDAYGGGSGGEFWVVPIR